MKPPSALRPLTSGKRGRPRSANPSPTAIRRRQYLADIKSGNRPQPKQVVDYISLKNKRNRPPQNKLGVWAERIYSRPTMRVGVHLPST